MSIRVSRYLENLRIALTISSKTTGNFLLIAKCVTTVFGRVLMDLYKRKKICLFFQTNAELVGKIVLIKGKISKKFWRTELGSIAFLKNFRILAKK